ncbi:MAG: hypothetical protein ACI4JC_10930, partial [Faecalibacterium sp.]
EEQSSYTGSRAAALVVPPVLAALNTRHLLRKPDCRLKSPTGAFLASPPPSISTRVAFLVLFWRDKREHSTGYRLNNRA